jgi:type I restriction-modification system DNA methylase subunit
MALKKSELYRSLWSSCDELRGGMDADIAALETKLSKYKQVKQGMMQNLLTGKIRLV